MAIELSRKPIVEIARAFARVLPRSPRIPVLGYLRFTREPDGSLNVTGTNLEETLMLKVSGVPPRDRENEEGFLVPFDEIRKIRKSLGRDGSVEFSGSGDGTPVECTVTTAGQPTTTRIGTLPVGEFPAETGQVSERCTAPLDGFLDAFRRIAPFASRDETRHVLQGLFWDHEEGVLVATDGRRLGRIALPDFSLGESLIIPRTRFLDKHRIRGEEAVDFGIIERGESVDFGIIGSGFEYRVRCIEGRYPNYRQVVPDPRSPFSGTVRIHPQDAELVRQAADRLAGSGADHALVLYADVHGVSLIGNEAVTQGAKAGDIHIRLPNSTYEKQTGDTAVSCVNATFLQDFVDAGFLSMRISEGFTPWLCEGGEGTAVVMPLRVDAAEPILAYAGQHLAAGQEDVSADIEPEKEIPDMEEKPETQQEPVKAASTPNLKVVEPPDPMAVFTDLLSDAQEKVREANGSVRELRKAARNVERAYRNRERDLAAREREIQKSTRLLAQLHESLAA